MKNTKLVVPVLLLVAVTLSCKLLNRKSSTAIDGVVSDLSKIADNLANYDPNDPPPSPGAAALRRLAELEPSVAKLVVEVESAERAALQTGLADLRPQRSASNATDKYSAPSQVEGLRARNLFVAKSPMPGAALPALFILQGQVDSAIGGAHDAALVGGLVTGLSDILVPHLEVGAGTSKSVTETKAGATSTMSVEIGRADDGSTKFGLGFKTEATKDGVAAKSELDAKIDGQRCPNAEGQLPFTIKVRLGAESGGTAFTRDVSAMVRAVVNDDAKIESFTMDLVQGTREVKDGRQVYVESGVTMHYDGSDYAMSNGRVIRHSQQATAENARPLSEAGLDAAFATGLTALRIAEDTWLKGGCTKIEAPSPGAVAPSSTTAIPVTVRHRFDGSEVPSKLDAVLKGGKSVDPTSIAKTSGTLTYIAPGETGKSATIALTATSRRGRATLDLTASTGGQSYRVSGASNGVNFSGEICSLAKPFTIDATFPGGSAKTTFTPSSVTGGTSSVSGGGGGCVHSGGGNYSVTLKDDGPGSITWTTTDKLACPGFSNSRTATFTLPLQPAPDMACP